MNILINTILTAADPVDIGEKFNSPWGKTTDLGDLIGIILTGGISLASIILLFVFIFAGLSIVKGAGNNDPKVAAQGQQALTYAITGFVIVFAAFWIIRIIEVITGSTFLTNPFGTSGSPPPLPPPGGDA